MNTTKIDTAAERAALLPCPFCGGEASLEAHYGREWWVQCSRDHSTGILHRSPAEAEEEWNRRASAAPAPATSVQQPTVEQLQAAIQRAGLTLLKTTAGYEVRKLGPSIAHSPIQQAAPAPVVPADSRDQALGLYVAQAEAICALLDKHAPDTHGNLQTRLAQALTRGSRIDADKLHQEPDLAAAHQVVAEAGGYTNGLLPAMFRAAFARHAAAELVSDALGVPVAAKTVNGGV